MRPEEKPSKGLVSRMRQLRGGGENQEDEEMKRLNTIVNYIFWGQLGLINRGRFLPRKTIRVMPRWKSRF